MAELKKWDELSEDKQKEIQKIYGDLTLLIEFSNKANQNLFIYLYGENLGLHLWNKFREFNNIITFFNYLDTDNRSVILANVYGQKDRWMANPIYAYCNR